MRKWFLVLGVAFGLLAGAAIMPIVLGSFFEEQDLNEAVYKHAFLTEIKSLDPTIVEDVYSSTVCQNIYETLFGYHYLKRPYTLQPQLAESLPEISADGLTWTIRLKKGIRFQDDPCFLGGKGRLLVAADFIYSLKRLADPATMAGNFSFIKGKIVGLDAWREQRKMRSNSFDAPIEGLQALDDLTLQLKLTEPSYQLQYILAMSHTSAIPREAVEYYGDDFPNHPVGTGPFKLAEWVHKFRLTLVKNENFRDEFYPSEGGEGDVEKGLLANAGKKLPLVNKLHLYEVPENQARWLLFLDGKIDCVDLVKDNFRLAVQDGKISPYLSAKNIRLEKQFDVELTYYGIQMGPDSFLGKHKKVRQALALAYDQEEENQIFQMGQAKSAQSLIAPGLDEYDPQFVNPYQTHNLEKARQLLVEAGFPGGAGIPELEYVGYASTTAQQQALFLKTQWEKIGIEMKPNLQASFPQFLSVMQAGKGDLYGAAWLCDYPDAENFLFLLNGGVSNNWSRYNNPEFNALYAKALTLPPGKERSEIYVKMRDIVVEDVPWIFCMHRAGFRLAHCWLQGYKPDQTIHDTFKYLSIDREAKKATRSLLKW